MKLSLTFSIILIITSFKLSAQTKTIEFGVQAGVSTTSLSRPKATDIILHDDEKSAFGYFAGVFASFNIHRFSVQPAVIYNSIAGNTTEEIITGDIAQRVYGKWRLNYIQVPVNLIYHFPLQGGKLYIGAGPYMARALSGRFTVPPLSPATSPSQDDNSHFNFDAKFGSTPGNNFKSFNYGINTLAGFEFDNGILINAVYNAGLTNIQLDNYLYNSTKTRSLGIALGYKF